MATRRQMREWAVQMLFQVDVNPGDVDKRFVAFWEDKTVDTAGRQATEELVRDVLRNLTLLDSKISHYALNWKIRRMGIVDRNVLRLAFHEMLFCNDIPPVVSINEAVDIAKYFSSADSGKFVNGILDRARKDLGRPAREAVSP